MFLPFVLFLPFACDIGKAEFRHTCVCVCVSVCVYVGVGVGVCVWMCVDVCGGGVHVGVCVCVCMCMFVCVHAYICYALRHVAPTPCIYCRFLCEVL